MMILCKPTRQRPNNKIKLQALAKRLKAKLKRRKK